jgi:hypothetical protein
MSGVIAGELWRAAHHLSSETRRRGLERAQTFDTATGEAIGVPLTGSATGTDISRHILAFQPGCTYVSLHTHPNSTSFSDSDVQVLAGHAALISMIAVGVDGTWFVMSRDGEASVTVARTITTDYLIELSRLRQARVPLTECPHLIMEHIVARHGWLYDRVTGSDDGSPPS